MTKHFGSYKVTVTDIPTGLETKVQQMLEAEKLQQGGISRTWGNYAGSHPVWEHLCEGARKYSNRTGFMGEPPKQDQTFAFGSVVKAYAGGRCDKSESDIDWHSTTEELLSLLAL